MSNDSPLQPEWEKLDIPEDDGAEPDDAGGDHFGDTPRGSAKESTWDKLLAFFNPSRRDDGSKD